MIGGAQSKQPCCGGTIKFLSCDREVVCGRRTRPLAVFAPGLGQQHGTLSRMFELGRSQSSYISILKVVTYLS